MKRSNRQALERLESRLQLKKRELAERWGITYDTLHEWEKGNGEVWSSIVVDECEKHGWDISEIYTGKPSPAAISAQRKISQLEKELREHGSVQEQLDRIERTLSNIESRLKK